MWPLYKNIQRIGVPQGKNVNIICFNALIKMYGN